MDTFLSKHSARSLSRDSLLRRPMNRTHAMTRLIRMTPLVALVALSACDTGDAVDFRSAVDHALDDVSLRALHVRTLPVGLDLSLDASAGVGTQIIDSIAARSACAEIERVDADTLLVDFGDVGDRCTLDGREVAGLVTIDFRSSETEIMLEQAFELYRDDRLGVSGHATLTVTADGRAVESSVTLTRDDRERNVDGSWTERPIELERGWDSGVVIDGVFDVAGCMGTATRELIGLELIPGERVPQAGLIRHRVPFGERSIEFERIDADSIAADVRFEPSGQRPDRDRLQACGGEGAKHHRRRGRRRGRGRLEGGSISVVLSPDGEIR